MEIKELTPEQIREIYLERIQNDFSIFDSSGSTQQHN